MGIASLDAGRPMIAQNALKEPLIVTLFAPAVRNKILKWTPLYD